VGVLGGSRTASVDEHGTITTERALWSVEWWIGAEDRWHLAPQEAAVRQTLVDGMPVARTAMRVPGGDALHEVFGATPDAVVVDVENASPAPFVAAFVVRGASSVALDDATVLVDGVPALTALRPPSRWAGASDGTLAAVVTNGDAADGSMPVLRDRAARLDVALLYPVAHRTRVRLGVALARQDAPGLTGLDLTAVPGPEVVARGWRAQLERGMRVVLPEPALQAQVDTDRAQLLLASQAWRADGDVVAALEDWGFDGEAAAAWYRLGLVARRRARRRGGVSDAHTPAGRLLALRRHLIGEHDARITLLPVLPPEWRGRPLDVREAPTRLGPVSYSVRWHGDRAALLWELPPGAHAQVPALDPNWSTGAARGETLLAPVE
jgi:hypothetical protein